MTRPGDPDAVSLVTILNLILRHRYLVAGLAALLFVVTVGGLLLQRRKYTAESSFMLQSRPSIPANLSGLAAQLGFTLPSGDANQSPAFYADLLQSREILSAVVDTRFALTVDGVAREAELADWLRIKSSDPRLRRERAIRNLKDRITVSLAPRTGVINLQVRTAYPSLSQQINQRMLTWLNEFNLEKRQSQAAAERKFTEARLQEAQSQLREAENQLLGFTQRNRDIRNSPLLTLEQDRLSREVSMRQQVYTSMVQAYDRAKIEEVRDTPVITILLQPEEPVRPDSRKILFKAILTLFVGVGAGGFLAAWRDASVAGRTSGSDDMLELARHRALITEDLRHPLRTLGRMARLGVGGPNDRVGV